MQIKFISDKAKSVIYAEARAHGQREREIERE